MPNGMARQGKARQGKARQGNREALRDSIATLQDAWKSSNISDREVPRVHDTGDAVRDAYLDSVAGLTTAWSRRR
jgi:hypothetical protein